MLDKLPNNYCLQSFSLSVCGHIHYNLLMSDSCFCDTFSIKKIVCNSMVSFIRNYELLLCFNLWKHAVPGCFYMNGSIAVSCPRK